MPKMERIFIRIDSETGAILREWFESQGTTLAGAIQDFLMAEYDRSQEHVIVESSAALDAEVEVETEPQAGVEGDS